MGMLCHIRIVNLATYKKLRDNICVTRSKWPHGLIYGSTAACLLELWVSISPGGVDFETLNKDLSWRNFSASFMMGAQLQLNRTTGSEFLVSEQ